MSLFRNLRQRVFPKYLRKPPNISPTDPNILYFYGDHVNGAAIVTEFLALEEGRGMQFRQTISSTNAITCQGRGSEGVPPYHYHTNQTEYFKIESGIMGYVVDGVEGTINTGGTLAIPPGKRHTWWVHVDPSNPQDLVVIVSADTVEDDGITEMFFRNLYAAFENGPNRFPAIFHLFALLDAGDVILAGPPKPIGMLLNLILGRCIGRWIGGYEPFDKMYSYPGGEGIANGKKTD